MSPELLVLIGKLIPAIASSVKDGMDILTRLQSGDEDAIAQAKDWLGVTEEVESAIAAWEASKTNSSA